MKSTARAIEALLMPRMLRGVARRQAGREPEPVPPYVQDQREVISGNGGIP